MPDNGCEPSRFSVTQGAERYLNDVARNYSSPRLSPDGTRLLVQAGDLWIQDLARSEFHASGLARRVINAFPIGCRTAAE
jgi:hypothetical protein